MIQSLSGKYKTYIAWPLFCIFYLQILVPISVGAKQICNLPLANQYMQNSMPIRVLPENKVIANKMSNEHVISNNKTKSCSEIKKEQILSGEVLNIGGPISPEASSFKAVGSNNLVNLANGSFSYSIPLLDVGGYPVNLFYASGIGIEQEASWVGLGWNINPGTVSRNMRGVPDDFNGTDLLIQTQNVSKEADVDEIMNYVAEGLAESTTSAPQGVYR